MIIQKSQENCVYVWILFLAIASFVFISIAYYNWPPKLNPEWTIGSLVGLAIALGLVTHTTRLLFNSPFKFEVADTEIIITDWGIIKPRTRKFDAMKVSEIYYSSEDASFLQTIDGKKYYIDAILMFKSKEIKNLVSKNFSHIRFRGID